MRNGLSMVMLAAVLSGRVAAQGAPRDPAATVGKNFGDVSGWVVKAAAMVPADKYGYRPVETVRTFGQLVGHIADAHNYYCTVAAGKQIEWADPVEKGPQDKAVLSRKLEQSVATCQQAQNGGRVDVLIDNLVHTSQHYGNIVTYLRAMGLVPPSS
jgi:uncharacterized damage-inducible protein DinB